MSVALRNLLRRASRHRLQVNIWPVDNGYQVNVKSGPENSWYVIHVNDPVEGLVIALRNKLNELDQPTRELFE